MNEKNEAMYLQENKEGYVEDLMGKKWQGKYCNYYF